MKLPSLRRFMWPLIAVVLCAGAAGAYFTVFSKKTAETPTFYAVTTAERGAVSSGIQTTGEIVAAQKLDVDVYKQLSRIAAVNVQNGAHVEKDQVLITFDKSDAYTDAESSRVAVAEARLALQDEQATAVSPSTQIRTLENQIAGYEKSIADAEQSIKDAYIDFLNEDLEVVPAPQDELRLRDQEAPALSGRYVSDKEGTYTIELYASGASSGYSFRYSGLETGVGTVIADKAVDLGTAGLKLTFPAELHGGDTWMVLIPNSAVATFAETRRKYEDTVADLKKTIADAQVNLANVEQNLADAKRMDADTYRDLGVEKAQSSLSEAQQRLAQSYDVVRERDIVAPFSGTVEGMENVVVGATPVGGTSDTINLGTLISDEFLTTFTLSAADVAKVSLGQKVKITVTSIAQQPSFDATVTEISSLPASNGVAQYTVKALLDYDRSSADLILREGMLANIEVVQSEKDDVLRIPVSAVTYQEGKPMVSVVDQLTEQQSQEAKRMGIVRTAGAAVPTRQAEVTLGIVGSFYAEVTSGLKEGDIVVTSSLAKSDQQSVVEQGFRPAGTVRFEGGTTGNAQFRRNTNASQ